MNSSSHVSRKLLGLGATVLILGGVLSGCTAAGPSAPVAHATPTPSSAQPAARTVALSVPDTTRGEVGRIIALTQSDSLGRSITIPAGSPTIAARFDCVGSVPLGWEITSPHGELLASSSMACSGVTGKDSALEASNSARTVHVQITGKFGRYSQATLVLVPQTP
jgi:hypothetical protein